MLNKLFAMTILLTIAMPLTAHAIECGSTIGPNQMFRLEADLTCPINKNITLLSNTILDLQWHTITCPKSLNCITLQGKNAQVWNGTIQGYQQEAILLTGQGGHLLWNVYSGHADGNIVVESDNNRLISVAAVGSGGAALQLRGNSNQVYYGSLYCPYVIDGGCVKIQGDKNDFAANRITAQDNNQIMSALDVQGNNNDIRFDWIVNEDGAGIEVSGVNNKFMFNNVKGTAYDIGSTSCSSNMFLANNGSTCVGE